MRPSTIRVVGCAAALAAAFACQKNTDEAKTAEAEQSAMEQKAEEAEKAAEKADTQAQQADKASEEAQARAEAMKHQPGYGSTAEGQQQMGSQQQTGSQQPMNRGELATTQTNQIAQGVHQIATAQCDRETSCNNVGPDRKYESRDECMSKIEGSYEDLSSGDCKTGLDPNKLSRCLQAIKAEECESPTDTLQRLTSCSSDSICRD